MFNRWKHFELHGTEWVLIDQLFDDASVSLPPFEAVSFNLADLWQPHVVPPRAAEQADCRN